MHTCWFNILDINKLKMGPKKNKKRNDDNDDEQFDKKEKQVQ